MAQSREDIAKVIASLREGDTVRVQWNDNDNLSTETGQVWDAPGTNFFGLGPDLLNPTDKELVGIKITKRAPVSPPIKQPPVGSVAVFSAQSGLGFFAYKRQQKGWYLTGSTGVIKWNAITAILGTPLQVFTPGEVPAAPTLDSITPLDGALFVEATLGNDRGAAITDVQYRATFTLPGEDPDDTGWVSTGQKTGNFTISDLTNAVVYTIRVRALNPRGPSQASNIRTGTPVAAGVPSAPTISSIAPSAQAAVITFTAPATDGGAPITNYEYSTDNATWTAFDPAVTASPATISGLTDGTTYAVRIRAVNAAGGGAASAAVSVTPAASAPNAPVISSATAGAGSAVIAFTAPTSTGGSPITNYKYRVDNTYSTSDTPTWVAVSPAATTSPITITGLTNGVRYAISIRAVNAVGDGAESTTVLVTPQAAVPAAPNLTGILAGDAKITLAWVGPTSSSSITNYEYSLDGGTWVAFSPAVTTAPAQQGTAEITGLTNGAPYSVRIRAVNASGAGAASNARSATPVAAPA